MTPIKIISLATLLVSAGCSTAPPPVTTVNLRKNQAAEFTEYGNTAYDQAHYDQALRFFLLALENNTVADFEEGMAKSYNSIGKALLALGENDRARNAFKEAQILARLVNNPPLHAQTLYYLGSLAIQEKKFEEGLRLMNQAKDYQGLDRGESAVILHGLGMAKRTVAIELDDYAALAESLTHFRQAAEINRSLQDYAELASNHYMSSLVLIRLKRLDEARQEALQALEYDRRMETSLGIAMNHRALGIIAAKSEDNETASQHFLRSYRILSTLNLTSYHAMALDLLIEALRKAGHNEEADRWAAERAALDA